MPPKARPQLRKVSISSHPAGKDVEDANVLSQLNKNKSLPKAHSTRMPPPPDPVPTTILGPEMQLLEGSLKEAALNTGKIFRFYADTRKEQIASHVPYPPSSTTRALGRSLERYDQICDTIEAQLLHAISILERDLKAEQGRIEAEASASVATRTRSKRPSLSPTATRIPLPSASPPPPGSEQQPLTESPTSTIPSSQFPLPSGASVISLAPRRPSAILSSLHRPGFPLKLDLSPAALAAGSVDHSVMGLPMDVNVDLGLTSLPSPVTLAPKTARALTNDSSIPDLFGMGSSQAMPMGAPDGTAQGDGGSVGMKTTEAVIDLTGPEPSRSGTAQLGDSADKPIELDLEGSYDDMDLFGDVPSNNDTVATASTTVHAHGVATGSAQLDVDMDGLFTPQDSQTNTFQLDEAISQNSNAGAAPDTSLILASLAANTGAGGDSNELSSLLPGGSGQSGRNNDEQSLPGHSSASFSGLGTDQSTEPTFDLSGIDLSSFSGLFDASGDGGGAQAGVGGEEDMDIMSQLLAMDGGHAVNPPGEGDANR